MYESYFQAKLEREAEASRKKQRWQGWSRDSKDGIGSEWWPGVAIARNRIRGVNVASKERKKIEETGAEMARKRIRGEIMMA
jgi:hypothetical protein